MKELPYYKFFPGEWLKGDVTVCSLKAQGLFINICAYYWMKGCRISLTGVEQRFSGCSLELQQLIDMEIITVDDGEISINFLNEQFSEFEDLRKLKSRAGKASAKVRRNNKRSTGVQQVVNKEDKIREEKIKEDNKVNIEFNIFWNLYNKKVGDKTGCEKKWKKLSDKERQSIMDTLPAFMSSIEEKKFQPHPATYLNQRRWEDEPQKAKSSWVKKLAGDDEVRL